MAKADGACNKRRKMRGMRKTFDYGTGAGSAQDRKHKVKQTEIRRLCD